MGALQESDAGGEVDGGAGGAAVRVRSRDGERFTYVPEARVESVQPASGPTRGGTEEQLQGSGLAPGQPLGCWVGGRVVAGTASSSDLASCTMPAGSAGFAGVAVGAGAAGLGEEAAVFLYREPAQVRGVFPRAAWHGGGALVHVSGSLSSPGLVSGVAPARGPAGGGTLLELQGAAIGDSKALHCSVGAVAPVAARWADAQAVECEAPAHAPGGAAVGLGVSAQLRVRGAEFTFTEAGAAGGAAAEPEPEPEPQPQPEEAASGGGGLERAAAVEEALAAAAVPRVTRVRPASGPAGGGTTVYVAGEGLHGGLVCSFGTVSRVASRWASGSGVECVSPARAPGAVELELEADAGAVSVRSRDGERFTYVPEARVESVQPASGPTSGGTEVQLQGSGLAPGQPLGCWVGGRVVAGTASSSDLASCTMPAGSAGFAGVAVGAGAAGLGEEAAVFLYREP